MNDLESEQNRRAKAARYASLFAGLFLPGLLLVFLLQALGQDAQATSARQHAWTAKSAEHLIRPFDTYADLDRPSSASDSRVLGSLSSTTTVTGLQLTCHPELVISKIDTPDPVAPGGNLVYTITFANVGNRGAWKVSVQDILPDETHYVSASRPPEVSGNRLTWSLRKLDFGTSESITVLVTVTSPLTNGWPLTNVVSIDSNATEPVTTTAVTTVFAPAHAPDLTIGKRDDPDPVVPGALLTYTIAYRNIGTATATGVRVTDTLPSEVRLVAAKPVPAVSGRTLVWPLPDLAPGEGGIIAALVTVTHPLTNGTVLTNLVEIGCDQGVLATATETTTVVSKPWRVEIEKADDPDPVHAGELLTYTITYRNVGAAVATGVFLTDVLPADTSYITATLPPTVSGNVLTWNVGNLAPASSDVITVVVKVSDVLTSGWILTNWVALDSNETIPVTDVETTTVSSAPFLSIDKAVNQDLVHAGETLVYTITYGNLSNVVAADAVITDVLPPETRYTAASVPPVVSGNTLVWDIGTLVPPVSGTLVVTAVANDVLPDCHALVNTVWLDSAQTTPISETVSSRTACYFYLPVNMQNHCNSIDVCNGDFEAGDMTCWTQEGRLARCVQSRIAFEGLTAELGSYKYACRDGVPKGEAAISQTLYVSECCPSPTLSFWYRIFSQDVFKRDKYDSFDVYVNDELILREGNTDWDEARCASIHWDSGWRWHTESLDEYKGKYIDLSFHNVIRLDWWYNTYTYVDNVEITCDPSPDFTVERLAAVPDGSPPNQPGLITAADQSDNDTTVGVLAGPDTCETPEACDAAPPDEISPDPSPENREPRPRHSR